MTAQTDKTITAKTSLRNRVWSHARTTAAQIDALVACGADALTAPILAARGVEPDDVESFLSPTIRTLMPNPSFFKDMDLAADRIARAITARENLAIWSDYDVDGATSAATLGRFLREVGAPMTALHIPDRIEEGYGPNAPGLLELQAQGADLVVVLDSGTTAFEPLQAASDAGLDVVVIDHHAAEEALPMAVAVVNPNRLDQAPGFNHLCAAGMTFIAIVAVNLRLRKAGWFDGKDGRPATAPDMMSYLDLVALGTICDVVPLKTLNRAFVLRGLPLLTARANKGVAALAAAAVCQEEIDERACGFALGPRINAGGRIGKSDSGAQLLLSETVEDADAMAAMLDALNRERQELEKACTAEALSQMEGFKAGEDRELAIAVTDAHEGVVGISAARLKEALDAPAFVLARTHDGFLKGSGRSVTGFDLGAAVIAARKAGLLVKGGGHAMAGGITLTPENLLPFKAFMDAEIARSDYAATGVVSRVDLSIPLSKATVGLVDATQRLSPFGMGNPTPRIAIRGAKVADVRIVKDKHLKLILETPALGAAGPRVDAVIWNCIGSPFADALILSKGETLDILGALEVNEWRGVRKVQVKLDDAMTP